MIIEKWLEENRRGLPGRWKNIFGKKYIWFSGRHFICTTLASTPAELHWLWPLFRTWLIPFGVFFIVLRTFVIVVTSNALIYRWSGWFWLFLNRRFGWWCAGRVCLILREYPLCWLLLILNVAWFWECCFWCPLAGAGLGSCGLHTYPAPNIHGGCWFIGFRCCVGTIAVIVRSRAGTVYYGRPFCDGDSICYFQVASYKLTKRRIFFRKIWGPGGPPPPIHHQFRVKRLGWTKVIVRFLELITVCLGLVGLAT